MDCSPPGSSVQRILQARVLEWVAISFSSPWISSQYVVHLPRAFSLMEPLPAELTAVAWSPVWEGLWGRLLCPAGCPVLSHWESKLEAVKDSADSFLLSSLITVLLLFMCDFHTVSEIPAGFWYGYGVNSDFLCWCRFHPPASGFFVFSGQFMCVLCFVAKSCPTLCDPVDYSHQAPLSMGILQTRILEWVAMLSSRGSSQPRDRTQVFHIADGFFTVWATRSI